MPRADGRHGNDDERGGMPTRPLSTNRFAEEVQGRLIDTHETLALVGLRSKQSLHNRIAAGKLPKPVITLERSYAFWDRVAVLKAASTRR
jgi:predicted DNA-binding transcriptional regulator AlpA